MHAVVRIIKNLFLDLVESAIAPNIGAHKEVSSMDIPLASPHIISPKFLAYTVWLTIIFVKYTGKIMVIITTAKDVLARSYNAHETVGSLNKKFKLWIDFLNLLFFISFIINVNFFYPGLLLVLSLVDFTTIFNIYGNF